jgi:leucyl-tRNA synthetase
VRERVLADEKVRASTDGKQVVKVIVVAGKLVNVVVR